MLTANFHACDYTSKSAAFVPMAFFRRHLLIPIYTHPKNKLIPIQKSKLTRRRAADSTDSTARRDNEVRLFFWIGITALTRLVVRVYGRRLPPCKLTFLNGH